MKKVDWDLGGGWFSMNTANNIEGYMSPEELTYFKNIRSQFMEDIMALRVCRDEDGEPSVTIKDVALMEKFFMYGYMAAHTRNLAI